MSPKKHLNFALVGLGRISGKHIEAINKLDNASITTVCDTDSKVLQKVVDATGVPGFSNLNAMLKAGHSDVAVILTPSGLHAQQGIAAAEAGLHVIVEKPMDVLIERAHKLVATCKEKKVQLFVVKQNRYNPTVRVVKEALDRGRFGKIYLIQANVFWSRPQRYYDQHAWRGTVSMDGGVFMNQASHYVDMMLYLGGDVERVVAQIDTLERAIEAEDIGTAQFRFSSGAMGTINATTLTHSRDFEGSLTIIGEKGTVRIGGKALNEIVHWNFENKEPIDEQVLTIGYDTKSVYGFSHITYYDHVARFLRGEDCEIVDGKEGLKSLSVLSSIYQSAQDQSRAITPSLFMSSSL